jgi:hypothetical protein
MIRTTLISLLVCLAAAPVWAQDEAETEKPAPEKKTEKKAKTALERTAEEESAQATAQELLSMALLKLRKQREFVVRAHVKEKEPEAEAQPAGGGQAGAVQIIMQAPGMGTEKNPYTGKVEMWRDSDGVTVLVSEKEIPGFGLYILPDKTIRQVTFETEQPGLDTLKVELGSLLDGERFVSNVLKSDLAHRVDEATGDLIWSGKVPREIVRPVHAEATGPAAMIQMRMRPRVLKANVEVRLSKDGTLKQAQVRITRNDPTREMMRGGFGGRVVIRGAGGGGAWPVPEKKAGGDKEKHEIEGKSTIYTIDFTAQKASERAKAFKRAIQRAVGK